MADENICEDCGEEFPTSRGLNIHNARRHPKNSENTPSDISFEDAKAKLSAILLKSKPSALLNALLKIPATRYANPNICLTEQECNDIDPYLQEVLDKIGAGQASKLAPYLPYIGLAMVGGPILLRILTELGNSQKGETPVNPPPKEEGKPADGSRPSLTRADVMPDA